MSLDYDPVLNPNGYDSIEMDAAIEAAEAEL